MNERLVLCGEAYKAKSANETALRLDGLLDRLDHAAVDPDAFLAREAFAAHTPHIACSLHDCCQTVSFHGIASKRGRDAPRNAQAREPVVTF